MTHANDASGETLIIAIDSIVTVLRNSLNTIKQDWITIEKIVERLIGDIENKRRIFILASGRSAMVGQMFQSRLTHIGLESLFITNSRAVPKLQTQDTLIVISGSGTTDIVRAMLQSYLRKNPFVIVLTSFPRSQIGRIGDYTIEIPGRTIQDHDYETQDIALRGTTFEIAAMVFLDSLIIHIADILDLDKELLDAEE